MIIAFNSFFKYVEQLSESLHAVFEGGRVEILAAVDTGDDAIKVWPPFWLRPISSNGNYLVSFLPVMIFVNTIAAFQPRFRCVIHIRIELRI